jgi:putative salt-induced outer membrane protein YdiY
MTRTLLLGLCALFLLPRAARADEVQFANGDRLTGKVVALKDGKLVLDSKLAGKIEVKWAGVATFTTDEPITLHLNDDSVIVDKVVAAEPGTVRTAGTSQITPQTIALANAVKVNPEPVQWHGTLAAGATFDRGNTHRTAGAANLDAVRRAEVDRITFGAGYIGERTRDADTGDDVTTKSQEFIGLQYDLFFAPKWYMLATSRAEKDRVAGLDLRLTTGVGLGYQFVETDELKANVELGPTWVSEHYEGGENDNDYVAARVAWNLDWVLYTGLTFFHHGRALPSMEDWQDQFVATDTGLRYKLFGNFFGESKVHWEWDSTPAEDKKRQDLTVILGLGYGF